MLALLGTLFSWLSAGPLDRILSSIDKHTEATTDREKIRTEAVTQYVQAQVSVANSRQWWFPVLFLVPAGLWFGAVCLYSIFWCRSCAFPQAWTIAALPEPLNTWMGWIVSSLFIGKAGEALISRLKK